MPGAPGVTKRLFFALWPTDETRAALVAASRLVLRSGGGRPVPADRYHVTLAFLGDQPATSIDRLQVMTSVATPEFDLVLDCFGHWPGPGVLWIGPRQRPDGLVALAAQIRAELDASGISYDGRDFKPHVTLARKVMTLPELGAPAPVHWPVRTFVLVQSVATPAGPVYDVIHRYPVGSIATGSRHDPIQD